MIKNVTGEYVAASIANVLSLPDACRLVIARGRLMQSLPTHMTGMLAVALNVDNAIVKRLISEYYDVDIAAVNHDTQVNQSSVNIIIIIIHHHQTVGNAGRSSARARLHQIVAHTFGTSFDVGVRQPRFSLTPHASDRRCVPQSCEIHSLQRGLDPCDFER